VARIRACPWLPELDDVRGYVLDLATGTPRAVGSVVN
jgi:hypothetical protein